jgi:methylmalonyl-CoA epimerase
MLKKIHHVGVVVSELESAMGFWRDLLGLKLTKTATIQDQGVKAALLHAGGTEIELLEPLDPENGVGRFLARRGGGIHHVCFESDDVAQELEAARAKGLELIDQKPRPGLAGMICFLHPRATRGVLVEYAQPIAEEVTPAPVKSKAGISKKKAPAPRAKSASPRTKRTKR